MSETGSVNRVASDTSGSFVNRSTPKYVREALADCVTPSGLINLHKLRMSEAEVARMKRTLRAEKAPYGRGRYYGVGIYR